VVNNFPVLVGWALADSTARPVDLHHPAKDRKLFGDHFAQAIAKVVSAYGTAADSELYGRAVADKLLPNIPNGGSSAC
jgi:hypothetical protein